MQFLTVVPSEKALCSRSVTLLDSACKCDRYSFSSEKSWLDCAAHLCSRSVTLLDSACKCDRYSFSSEKSWLDCAGCCESSCTQSLTLASLPLCQAGLSFWSCILILCHHIYCLLGAVWRFLALLLTMHLVPLVHSMHLVPLVHSMHLVPWVHSMHLVLFVHSMDLQPFAMVHSMHLVPWVHSMHLVLFVHSMDLQPFAMVHSMHLVQDVLEDLTFQSSQKGASTNAY